MSKKKKKKNNKVAAAGKKAAPETKPGGKFTIPLVAALIVATVLAFGVYFNMRRINKRCMNVTEKLDAQIESLDTARLKGTDIWLRLDKGEIPLQAAVDNFQVQMDAIEKIREDIKAFGGVFEKGGDTCSFCVKQRNALDAAEGVKDLVFALATEAQFRMFGEIEEGAANRVIADRLSREMDKKIHDLRKMEWSPGMDVPQKPVADDAEYVFVVLIDTTRADHLGAYGYPRNTSPTIDKLASEGILFENAFSQCSTTDTSVASLLTAVYPRTHKMMGRSDWLWELSLVDVFRKAGYVTGGFSSNSLVSGKVHFDNGFDYFEEMFWGRATVNFGQAKRWLEKTRTNNKKIFTYIHLMDPHDLYFPPPQYIQAFGGNTNIGLTGFGLRKLIEEAFPDIAKREPMCDYNPYLENWDRPELLLQCISKAGPMYNFGMKEIDAMRARYDAEILYADTELKNFLAYLEENNMLEKSAIVVLADHGESFLEHNQAKHGRVLFDNEIHVPLVFWRGKENFGGRRVAEPVEIIDTLPTLMGMTGVKAPAGLHGRDLLNSKPADGPDPVYALSWNGSDIFTGEALEITMVREFPFKYIRAVRKKNSTVYGDGFYNLETDPGEMTDAREQSPEDFRRLQEKLDWWNEATDRKGARDVKEGMDADKMKKLRDLGYVND